MRGLWMWQLLMLLAIATVGCSPSTSLLIEVTDSNSGVTFSSLRVDIFGPNGSLGTGAFAPAPLPGAVRVENLPSHSEAVRVVVAGLGAAPSLSGVLLQLAPGKRNVAKVDLTTPMPDSDGDGIPDALDDCPSVPDPGQQSTLGGAPGNACGGGGAPVDGGASDLGGSAGDLATSSPKDQGGTNSPDLATPVDMAGVLLNDDFNGNTLNTTLWHANTDGGASYAIGGGMLTLTAPTAAAAFAEIASVQSFDVGTTFEASVSLPTGQTYDEKGIGYANLRLSDDCSGGETEAAMFRGFNDQLVIEPKTGNLSQCIGVDGESTPYTAGTRVFKVVRLSAGQIDFYDGTSLQSDTARVPQGALPVRLGVFTSTANPPGAPVVLKVDWARVTKP